MLPERGLPSFAPLRQDGLDFPVIHFFPPATHDGKIPVGDVDENQVSIFYKGDRAAPGCLR